MRVAVVAVALEPAAVERNLRHVADVARQAAREHDPDLLVLPDGITTPNVYAPAMRAAARPVDGEPYELLRRIAREHACFVSGGFLAVRGGDVRSTHVLAEPNGATHLHDKDQPDLWESAYAAGGADDGFCSTPIGPLGLVGGLEWLRSRTAERLRGFVRVLAGGASWPPYPDWWPPRRDRGYAAALAREAAPRMARLVGAPAAVAHQVGRVSGHTPLAPGLRWRGELLGESQIVERDGRILARVTAADGEGYAAADVRLTEPAPLDAVPEGFWLALPPASMHASWLVQGAHGRFLYRRRHAARRFPWQALPERDLLAYNPPGVPPEERPERQPIANPWGPEPAPPEELAGAASA